MADTFTYNTALGQLEFYVSDGNTYLWRDAWQHYGVRMGDGFAAALNAPAPMKDYIEGQSRLEHGKSVVTDNARTGSRDVTLTFYVHGDADDSGASGTSFLAHLRAFCGLLYTGLVTLRVTYPDGSQGEVFRLIYKKSTTYAQSRSRVSCSVAVKFEEPDVTDREE